jgi:hypothetical protein
LVEGVPVPVTATARRSATATALNTDSKVWWVLSPDRLWTCRVMRAVGHDRLEEVLDEAGLEVGPDDLDRHLQSHTR